MNRLHCSHWIVLLVLLAGGLAAFLPSPAIALEQASGVQINNPQVDSIFGESLTFHASIKSSQPVASAVLFLQPNGTPEVETVPVELQPDGSMLATVDLKQFPIRVFSQVAYTYQLTFQNGQTYTSEDLYFTYEDDRFTWRVLENKPFRFHWYDGELPFAQEGLNIAHEGLQRAQGFLNLVSPTSVDIYAYSSARDMRAALQLSGQSWVAGHANPDLATILVSLPPGPEQRLEMERQIPHELMHVLIYQAAGAGYARLPTWFNEGLASINELYPNPDYQILLESAFEKKSLLPISSLCQAFPRDASNALLAYAQSASFTRYLFNRFGMPGMEKLSIQFISGLDCEYGVKQALGADLSQLEADWRREVFGEDPWKTALVGIMPWVILLLVALAAPIILTLIGLRKNPSRQRAGSIP